MSDAIVVGKILACAMNQCGPIHETVAHELRRIDCAKGRKPHRAVCEGFGDATRLAYEQAQQRAAADGLRVILRRDRGLYAIPRVREALLGGARWFRLVSADTGWYGGRSRIPLRGTGRLR